jgi:hypothetical protein
VRRVWPAICFFSFPFVNPQRQPSIHDDVQAIRIPTELPRDLAIAVAEMSDFTRESLQRKNDVPRTICRNYSMVPKDQL